MAISPKRTLSAFRIISIALFLDFPFNSRGCLQLAWNPTLGGFASKRCPRNSPYAFSPTTFAFNRYPCALLFVKHSRYYCSVLNGFIQLLFSKAISDFTSAPSLFASLVLLRSVCLELDLFRSTRSLGCLKKYFDLQQLLLNIITRIILANCSYFKAKDFGTPCCPLSFRLLTWLINWNPTKKLRVWVTDLDLKSTKRQIIIGLRMGLLDVGHLREECW